MGHIFSKCVSKIVLPCSKLIGKLPSCCGDVISDNDIEKLSNVIEKHSLPGDFILSHIDNRPTNIFFGGSPYTHLGIITMDGCIIDMVASGCRKVSVIDWLKEKDRILVIRASTISTSQTHQIVKFAEDCYKARTPYDFSFEVGINSIYCTELGYLALRSIDINLPYELGLDPTVGGFLQSTTYRANSFIESLRNRKIVPILEWRYEEDINLNVDIERLLNDTIYPSNANDKSKFLFELTKLAYPFNKDRLLLIRENNSVKRSCFTNKALNRNRYLYNIQPKGDLHEVIVLKAPFRVFRDSITLEVYIVVPQISNILHNPCKWTKLVSFDAVHGIPESLGSTEILVPNEFMKGEFIPKIIIKQGSYNYRDLYIAGRFDHFFLDICRCIC